MSHSQLGSQAGDILVDGLVAHTFTPEDADNYFNLLLNTPAQQYFLPYYGIVHHQGAWFITHNVNSVQNESPGVPLQTAPLLDYSIRGTHGTVVSQRRWTPVDDVDIRRHVEDAALNLPIFFVNHNGKLGFSLTDILRGCDRHLHNANGFAPLGGRATTQIRINWPGYRFWRRQIPTRDETSARNPITLARLMRRVGVSVNNFLTEYMSNGYVAPDRRWQIGMHGIRQEHVKILGVVHVSAGSWMPILQLTYYVI
ncbi:hypothetical protein V8E53_008632 [Lactarius tabidus]